MGEGSAPGGQNGSSGGTSEGPRAPRRQGDGRERLRGMADSGSVWKKMSEETVPKLMPEYTLIFFHVGCIFLWNVCRPDERGGVEGVAARRPGQVVDDVVGQRAEVGVRPLGLGGGGNLGAGWGAVGLIWLGGPLPFRLDACAAVIRPLRHSRTEIRLAMERRQVCVRPPYIPSPPPVPERRRFG